MYNFVFTMKLLTRALLRLPLFLCADVMFSQTSAAPEQLTLDAAIALALRNNRDIQIAQADVAKAQDQVGVARSYRLPKISVDADGFELLTPISFHFTQGVLGTYPMIGPIPGMDTSVTTPRRPIAFVSATVTEPLSQQFRIGLGIQLSRLEQKISEMRLRLKRQTAVGDVKKVYFGMLRAQASLEAVQESQKALAELDRVVGQYVLEQAALKSEGMEVKSKVLEMSLTAMQLKHGIESAQEQMNHLLGRAINTAFAVAGIPEAGPEEEDVDRARRTALRTRPDLEEARLKLKEAELDLRSRRSERIPDFSLVTNYLSPFSISFLPRNVAMVGFSLSWKPFDWGKTRHEVSEKSQTVEQARTAVSLAESGVLIEVGAGLRKLEESRLKLQIARLNRDTAGEHLRVSTTQFSEKATLLREVLQRQAELSESTNRYQEALLEFWTAKADFDRAIGEDQ